MKNLKLHFVGIGGIGMSGIAEVFLNQGYSVSGSDLVEGEMTRQLSSHGADISIGHRAENVVCASVVVISSAVKKDNPEVVEARRLRIPIIPRAEMLGELMRGKCGIAVAGAHGKTTTTSMLASILSHAALDPTILIGGKVDSIGGNAKLGQGKYVVAEADESDGSFLHLPSTYAVITNIDNDHLDHFGTVEAIDEAFVQFVAKLPFYGKAAICADDAGVQRCMSRFIKPVVTYGLSTEWDVFAKNLKLEPLGSRFEVYARRAPSEPHFFMGEVSLFVPGKHNAMNALGAIAIALELGVPFATIVGGLDAFRGVNRRFQIRWRDEGRKRVVIDDYGHHPVEVAATLASARNFWGDGRIIAVFQPHRYSRTLHCEEGFVSSFREADAVYMTDIYAAGEAPIAGVNAAALCHKISIASSKPGRIEHVGDLGEIESRLLSEMRDGDMILCLGAGSITKLAERLAERLMTQSAAHG